MLFSRRTAALRRRRLHTRCNRPLELESLECRRLLTTIPQIHLSVDVEHATESDSTQLTIAAFATHDQQSFEVEEPVAVELAIGGDGLNEDDYQLSSPIITMPIGSSTESVTLTIVNDNLVETPLEIATVLIASLSDNAELSPMYVPETFTVLDDDRSILQLSDAIADETESLILFTAYLSNPVDVPVTAKYSTQDGTAVSGVDYVGIDNGMITFQPGETTKEISVELLPETSATGRSFEAGIKLLDPAGRAVTHPVTRVSNNTEPYSDIRTILFTPDSNHVVFHSTVEGGFGQSELFSRPLRRDAPAVRLNPPLGSGGIATSIRLSEDGSQAVFFSRHDSYTGLYDLFSAAVDGSTGPIKLASEIHSIFVAPPTISPDGRYVLFRDYDSNNGNLDALFAVPIDGSAPPVQISDPDHRLNFQAAAYFVGDDDTTVVYQAGPDLWSHELYSVSITGGVATKLTPDFVENGGVFHHQLTPDRSHLIYYADQESDGQFEIFRVPVTGGPAVKLNEPLVEGETLVRDPFVSDHQGFVVTADGSSVVYLKRNLETEFTELFIVPLADGPGPATKLSGGHNVSKFRLAPSGQSAFFTNQDGSYHTSIATGEVTKISHEYAGIEFQVSPDGRSIVYASKLDFDARDAIYKASIDHPEQPLRLSGSLRVYLGDYHSLIDPDSQFVYFYAQNATGGQDPDLLGNRGLFRVSINGGEPSLVSDPNEDGGPRSLGGPIRSHWGFTPDDSVLAFESNINGEMGNLNVMRFSDQSTATIVGSNEARIDLNGELNMTVDAATVTASSADEELYRGSPPDGMLFVHGDRSDDVLTINYLDQLPERFAIDGGDGLNSLALVTDSGHVDLTGREVPLRRFQKIDISASVEGLLRLDAFTVNALAGDQPLAVTIGKDDYLSLRDAGDWEMLDAVWRDGHLVLVARHDSTQQAVEVHAENPWHNLLRPGDANNDGDTTSADALRVINELRSSLFSDVETRQLLDVTDLSDWPSVFFDQNGDGYVTGLDALRIINELAQDVIASPPESEQRLVPLTPTGTDAAKTPLVEIIQLDTANLTKVQDFSTRSNCRPIFEPVDPIDSELLTEDVDELFATQLKMGLEEIDAAR